MHSTPSANERPRAMSIAVRASDVVSTPSTSTTSPASVEPGCRTTRSLVRTRSRRGSRTCTRVPAPRTDGSPWTATADSCDTTVPGGNPARTARTLTSCRCRAERRVQSSLGTYAPGCTRTTRPRRVSRLSASASRLWVPWVDTKVMAGSGSDDMPRASRTHSWPARARSWPVEASRRPTSVPEVSPTPPRASPRHELNNPPHVRVAGCLPRGGVRRRGGRGAATAQEARCGTTRPSPSRG